MSRVKQGTSVKAKNNPNKKFVKLNLKRNWKKLSFLVLALFIMIASIIGYSIYQTTNEELADAAGYATIASNASLSRSIKACRIGTTAVQLILTNDTSEPSVDFWWLNGGYGYVGGFSSRVVTVTRLNSASVVWGRIAPSSYGSRLLGGLPTCLTKY